MPEGVEIQATAQHEAEEILERPALEFIASLARRFESRRVELLHRRVTRQQEIDSGKLPDFLPETKKIRDADWKVASIPHDLVERKVEITGPVERKMIVNALNSGAHVFMADFEDSNSPTWHNNLQGQINLRDTVNDQVDFTSPEGKHYALGEKTATLMVRPRGWHLVEKHLLVDGAPVSASLFDFGLYFFHNAKALLKNRTGPYFYLPKMESHLEARLWNDVFNFSQDALGISRGTIRATALIETILAAFEMDEILYELKDHSAGLNCGRWDYIFSFIKKFSARPDFVLPDRVLVTMDKPFLDSYVRLLIRTCHRRGIHAMGGMAAQIPIKDDAAANKAALEKVKADKLREVLAGHDGTWVAHPALVSLALEIFNKHLPGPNQIHRTSNEPRVSAKDLLSVPAGEISEKGLRTNINVGILYLESWLRGAGCVPLYHLMEDAATAEISRAQVWQWARHKARMSDGRTVTAELVRAILDEELEKIRRSAGEENFSGGKFSEAAALFMKMTASKNFPEFLTLEAYDSIG